MILPMCASGVVVVCLLCFAVRHLFSFFFSFFFAHKKCKMLSVHLYAVNFIYI